MMTTDDDDKQMLVILIEARTRMRIAVELLIRCYHPRLSQFSEEPKQAAAMDFLNEWCQAIDREIAARS